MIVAYIGNFRPEHSTENHLRQAWENQGHKVIRVQEGVRGDWERLLDNLNRIDLVLWTRTASEAALVGHRTQRRMLAAARASGVPTVAFHLDRWWDLDREASVWTEPFFLCDVVITADGGHQDEFASVGVNHVWLPPAVSLPETEPGDKRAEYTSGLAFVGSWQPGYHAEWTHRPELVGWLKHNYPRELRLWPRPGKSIRGKDLRDLYASVDIVVGDSCLVGDATHYWSDRIPETVGRGAFLLHPYVIGLEDHFTPGVHMETWPLGDFDALMIKIDYYMANPDKRKEIAAAGREHVRTHHTYDVRVNQIIELAGAA